jgi:hypothetical protein
MEVVQGTQVRIDVTVTDPDTGQPTDPITLVCRIQDPTGDTTDQTLAQLTRLGLGRYRAIMDTSACANTWSYQWTANNLLANVLRGTVNVTPAI